MEATRYDGQVREQYEAFPYPMRSPADEAQRLCTTWLDDLPKINHYCFRGGHDFGRGFRVLVAGGGTGDATIYLAEQFRDGEARIVHLDISARSMEIARERARVRGLDNIDWVAASVLDLPRLGLGRFDYINCSGVLHHLPDPDAGLAALESVLAEEGALGIMVYGKYGRTAVYQVQELLRLVNRGEEDMRAKIDNARAVLRILPPTNWWRRGEERDPGKKALEMDDSEIFDLFLHSRDRAYSVPELCRWMEEGHGLHLHFTDVMRGRSPYLPEKYLAGTQPELLGRIKSLPLREQYAIAELLAGDIITHSFFATRRADSVASPDDLDNVPCFFHDPVTGEFFHEALSRSPEDVVALPHQHSGATVLLARGRHLSRIFRHLDGERTEREIFDRVRNEPGLRGAPPSDDALLAEFRPAFDALNAIDRMLLRHRSVPRPMTAEELQARMRARTAPPSGRPAANGNAAR
jgi:SAM-dependent methyltransferase